MNKSQIKDTLNVYMLNVFECIYIFALKHILQLYPMCHLICNVFICGDN